MRRSIAWTTALAPAISGCTPRTCRARRFARDENKGARRHEPAGSPSNAGLVLPLVLAERLLRLRDVRRILLDHAQNLAGGVLVDGRALGHRDLRGGPHRLDELRVGAALRLVEALERLETDLEGRHADEELRVGGRRGLVDAVRDVVGSLPAGARLLLLRRAYRRRRAADQRVADRRLVDAGLHRRVTRRERRVGLVE